MGQTPSCLWAELALNTACRLTHTDTYMSSSIHTRLKLGGLVPLQQARFNEKMPAEDTLLLPEIA